MTNVDTPEQFAAQLSQLTCLASLALSANIGGSHTEPVLQPVVDCIMGSPKRLWMGSQQLTAEHRAKLQAVAHITVINISADSGV